MSLNSSNSDMIVCEWEMTSASQQDFFPENNVYSGQVCRHKEDAETAQDLRPEGCCSTSEKAHPLRHLIQALQAFDTGSDDQIDMSQDSSNSDMIVCEWEMTSTSQQDFLPENNVYFGEGNECKDDTETAHDLRPDVCCFTSEKPHPPTNPNQDFEMMCDVGSYQLDLSLISPSSGKPYLEAQTTPLGLTDFLSPDSFLSPAVSKISDSSQWCAFSYEDNQTTIKPSRDLQAIGTGSDDQIDMSQDSSNSDMIVCEWEMTSTSQQDFLPENNVYCGAGNECKDDAETAQDLRPDVCCFTSEKPHSTKTPSEDKCTSGLKTQKLTDKELKLRAMKPRSKKKCADDVTKDDIYQTIRKQNNLRSKTSRLARRNTENHIVMRVAYLEEENASIKEEIDRLKMENTEIEATLRLYGNYHGDVSTF